MNKVKCPKCGGELFECSFKTEDVVTYACHVYDNGDFSEDHFLNDYPADRILVEEFLKLEKDVIFAVKGAPILNDATMKDAIQVGMDKTTTVVGTGSDRIGTDLKTCSDEFKNIFNSVEILISKGQGNFETLNEEKNNIYFILKAKCSEVAGELGIKFGDRVLLNYKFLP